MNKILGLDISTKTGFAVIDDGKLVLSGLLKVDPVVVNDDVAEDFAILARSILAVDQIMELVNKVKPNVIFAEQTNAGRFRTSQKQLEFIHCLLLFRIQKEFDQRQFMYVDTSKWRSTLQIRLSKDQRKHNKDVKLKQKRGKITPKHLAVAWVNECFKLQLKLKDNDIADAICLAAFGERHLKAPARKATASDTISEILLTSNNKD